MSGGLRSAWLCVLLALAGCGSVLGIEELSSEGGDASVVDEPGGKGGNGSSGRGGSSGSGNAGRGGSGGSSGESGTGGSESGSGGSSESGTGGGESGTSGSAGSAESGTGGGESGSGGSGDSGTGGSAGTPATPAVHGKVIDYYRNPIKDVAVKIGDATATTNAEGEFTIDDVAATYDVAITVTALRYGNQEIAGWLYMGLTRRDPTLQVYRGHPLTDGDVLITTNPDTLFPLPSYDTVALSFASPWGEYNTEPTSPAIQGSMGWEGPNNVSGTVHALRWSDATTVPHVPVAYHAHAERALSLDEDTQSSLTLDMAGSGSPMPSAMVAGTITAPSSGERINSVFLRYNDNAAIQLVDERNAPNTFSYLVPSSIANTTISVAASMNNYAFPPFAVAYKEGVTPGTNGIALAVPSPATSLAPGSGTTNVDGSTMFTWQGSDQVYLFHAESDTNAESYYVVTSAKQARIPAPPVTNLALRAGAPYYWDVSTHITHATVDAATGPEGFLDSYCTGEIGGPTRGTGSHTISASFGFTTKP